MQKFYELGISNRSSLIQRYRFELIEKRRKLSEPEKQTYKGTKYFTIGYSTNDIPEEIKKEVEKEIQKIFSQPTRRAR